jgi:two-component SAPR family response regulator
MKQINGIISKISRPRISSALNRVRLFDLIEKNLEFPAIWISGTPGAGKTTLAASYIKSRNIAYIWYQMDSLDDDPATFFHYMTLAASKTCSGKAVSLPGLSPENFLSFPNYAVQYFRELFDRLEKPFILVLDNYQEVSTGSLTHELIKTGIEQVPFGLNILILSRTPPPPVMTRLLVNKTLMPIQPEALSLTEEESIGIAALADKWKPYLESAAQLHQFTGGWTAGLVLMLEYAKPGEATQPISKGVATDIFFNYFAGEIFNQMNPAVQDFLLTIACMPSFTPESAEKVSGFCEAGIILADMNRKNYFTEKKINHGTCYQFHPLFREFLLSKALESFEPQRLTELYRRAAGVLAEAGQLEDAFDLYTRSKDKTAQADLIRNHAAFLVSRGRVAIVERWLKALPQDTFSVDPWLVHLYGQCRLPFDPLESRNAFIHAFNCFKHALDFPALVLTISGIIETIQTEWGDFRQLDPWIEELGTLLKDPNVLLSTEVREKAEFALFSAFMFRQPQHSDMKHYEERMVAMQRFGADAHMRIIAGTYLLHYLAWKGEILQARFVIAITRDLVKSVKLSPLAYITVMMCDAVFCWFTADLNGCLAAVNKGLEVAEKTGIHIIDNWLMAQEVYARLTLDDPELAKTALDKMKPDHNTHRFLDISHHHHLYSVYYLQAGNYDFALQHSKEALRLSELSGTPFPEALNCIIAAQIYFERGDVKKAYQTNTRAETIGHAMRSHLLEMLALFNQAYFCLKTGKYDQVNAPLRAALAIRKERGLINFSCWRRGLMQDLYEEALRSGIEVEYVKYLIKKRDLHPRVSSLDVDNWPWRLKISTLGRFELSMNEKPLLLKRKPQLKPLELLKALVALGGKQVSLSSLEDLLWPDAEGDKAHKALIITLYRLRKLIGHEKAVKLNQSRISLNDRFCWLDVWAVEYICSKAPEITARITSDANAVFRAAEKLLQLYKGDFLKNDNDLLWVTPFRVKLRSKFVFTLASFARALEKQNRHEDAINLYHRGLQMDELAEELYQGLMMCYHKLGRTTEGLLIYNSCRETLLSVLGTSPSSRTESIRRTLQGGPSGTMQ